MARMVTSPTLLVVLTIFTVARVTTFITRDYLTAPLRVAADARAMRAEFAGPWAYFAYLISCNWCSSVYVGMTVTGAVYAWHAYWPTQILLIGLSASYLTGLAAERLTSDTESD